MEIKDKTANQMEVNYDDGSVERITKSNGIIFAITKALVELELRIKALETK